MYKKLGPQGESFKPEEAFQGGVGTSFKCYEDVATLILVMNFQRLAPPAVEFGVQSFANRY